MIKLNFSLPACHPFRLDLTVWALRRRNKNIIDSWDGIHYVRIFAFENHPIKINVEQKERKPQITITTTSLHPMHGVQEKLTTVLNKMLGLTVKLEPFYQLARNEEKFRPLINQFMGLKPPCFPSIFESLTNAIACQQVSLESGLTLLNRLSQHYGLPFQETDKIYYAFPDANTIMNCNIKDLKALGFSQRKSEALINLASVITSHKDAYSNLEQKPDKDVVVFLSNLKGIGRWSIEYAMLRGLGRVGILPGDDVGFQKSLKNFLEIEEDLDYNKIKEIEEKWSPYGGLIYFHLLLQKLYEKRLIS